MKTTKENFMKENFLNMISGEGIKIDETQLYRIKMAEEEWWQINNEQNFEIWARAWKYFYNLHRRKLRKNTLNGRKT